MARVLYQLTHHTGVITLSDPENLNAMGEEMADEFAALVAKLQAEERKPRAIILTGAGRAFSAGGNLDMLEKKQQLKPDENRKRMIKFYHSFLDLLKLNVPLIAAINGHAVGAGLCIAAACDVRVASEKAKLGFTFTRLGLHPGMGATYFLPRVIGAARAVELMITGRLIEADAALAMGLVSKVVPTEQVLPEAQKIAQEIGECGPESVRHVIESVRVDFEAMDACLEREAHCQSLSYASAEFKEGVRAAIEKRAAKFE